MTTDHEATRPSSDDLRHSQERTIGQLVAQVTDDLRFIVRKEIELAKTEISSQLGIAGKGAGMLAPALAITVALVISAIVIALIGENPVEAANLHTEGPADAALAFDYFSDEQPEGETV